MLLLAQLLENPHVVFYTYFGLEITDLLDLYFKAQPATASTGEELLLGAKFIIFPIFSANMHYIPCQVFSKRLVIAVNL